MDKEMEKLLSLAAEIQKIFKVFYLAGGTAIMFKHNHRESIDLDFFKGKPFSFTRLSLKVRNYFQVEKEEKGQDSIDFYIDKIRVSFVFFPFKNINRLENIKGVKKADDYDIFLNKIYVAGRRIDPKDAYDAAFLYKTYRWDKEKIERDFELKFPDQSYKIYLGALLSFEDYPELPDWVKEILMDLV
ncbi:MAG: nucleotidyl transferase AbiEii/AbiGii toxin family protein [Nitrospirae bacterium]|nr:nucleotidyl transferase AbiEii/AbiGii toxin family protein [Nitrospirota bacterium]